MNPITWARTTVGSDYYLPPIPRLGQNRILSNFLNNLTLQNSPMSLKSYLPFLSTILQLHKTTCAYCLKNHRQILVPGCLGVLWGGPGLCYSALPYSRRIYDIPYLTKAVCHTCVTYIFLFTQEDLVQDTVDLAGIATHKWIPIHGIYFIPRFFDSSILRLVLLLSHRILTHMPGGPLKYNVVSRCDQGFLKYPLNKYFLQEPNYTLNIEFMHFLTNIIP